MNSFVGSTLLYNLKFILHPFLKSVCREKDTEGNTRMSDLGLVSFSQQ